MAILPDHWYYNTESGQLTQGNNVENLANNLFGGLGWHELNIPGNATEAQAAAEAVKEFPTGKKPTAQGLSSAIPSAVGSGIAQGVGSILGGIGSISIGGISGTNLAIRGAKIIVGALILLVGLVKLTGIDQGIAGKAVKAAPFL